MANVEGMPSTVASHKRSYKQFVVLMVATAVLSAAIIGLLNYPWLMAQSRYHFSHHTKKVAVLGASTTTPTAADAPAPKPDPSAPAEVIIPAINVKAPIVFEPTRVEWKVQVALRSGVVHYADTALPGQADGNVVIFGHSSGQLWAPGNYKWIFTLLDKLQPGDQIQINYQGIPYIYEVTDKQIVAPTDLDILTQTKDPTLTLVTCTPVGSSTNRLLVHAKPLQAAPERH